MKVITMRLLDREALRSEKGISYGPVHLWRLWNAGKFPKPVKIGFGQGARNCWPESEIDAWLAQRISERDATA